MRYEIKDFKAVTLDRGLLSRDEQPAHTAIIKFDNGDWIGVSRYHDESYWVADCAFNANGMPRWSNGTGARVTAVQTLNDDVSAELNALM